MKNVIFDIWQDLREKRLWPVALLLLVALVAVPVVLAKSGDDSGTIPAPGVATPKPTPKESDALARLATVELEESAPGEGSTLDTFDPSNPFRPPEKVVKKAKETEEAATAGPTDDVRVQVDDTVVDDTVEGGGGSGGSTPDDGGTTGGGDQPQETVTTQSKYVIDVTFTANGKTRKVKGMERLDILPNQGNPLLLFLGAESDGGNAVFLVDSTLTAAGEGRCKPSASKCAFLHIGPGSEHEFTNEQGDSYTLQINEIRKVKVEEKAKGARRGAKAGASVGSTRRFAPLAISDLVTETTGSTKSTDESDQPDADGAAR